MTTPSDEISLSGVLSETVRILKAYRNHFLILNLLFLLPTALLLITYTTIYPFVPQSSSTFTATPSITFLQILYIIISWVFSISAAGTITYSVFHGYYNRPLELIPTLKSLSASFIPLCSTSIVLQLINTSVGFLSGILGAIMYIWLESFTWMIIMMLIVFCCLMYMQVKWFISNVIVVVESKWGYEPLRRSAYLMKGMRMIALKMMVLFGVPSSLFMYYYYWNSSKANTDGFLQWISSMVVVSCGMTILMEYSLAATVVLYIYCMKFHGELAMEIQPQKYVSLFMDDDGNKSVAAVVLAS